MIATGRGWQVEEWRGQAGELHAADLLTEPVRRRVVWMRAERPALVLGSSQPEAVADAAACARLGVDVVRRRSGGGAVLVDDDAIAWVDVVVPAGDPLAADDVGAAMWWLGDVWAEALAALGVVGAVTHRGPLVTTQWSRAVCFAGLGAGEVTVDGVKLVGISQRRTRLGARFQCMVHRAWAPGRLVELLAPPRPVAADLPPVGIVAASVTDIRSAFDAAIHMR